MDLDDCYQKGLLKRTRRQPDLARKDLRQAAFFLREAEELLGIGKQVMTALALCNAYFHAARALLFLDGVKERSHYCIARYLEAEYVKKRRLPTSLLDAFETMMSIRHNAQYSTESVQIEEDLQELHGRCAAMIEEVRRLIR